jgi:hypothetical protein
MHRFLCLLLLAAGITTGCTTAVQVTHYPLVAKSNETITFTAIAVTNTPPDSVTIEIMVNDELKQTCTSSPCTFTGGPYPLLEDGLVFYNANIEATYTFKGKVYTHSRSDGYYFTGITDENYDWQDSPYLYGRVGGNPAEKEDFVFHMASDYEANDLTFSDFIADASFKVQKVFGKQAIVNENLGKFNFWVYKKKATAAKCGGLHADADKDMPFRDDAVVLHFKDFTDCTKLGLAQYSAEGSNTKAFLHEAGHCVFGLGDEYDATSTNYSVVQSPQPNIFASENECQTEQTSQGRDPNVCFQFTAWMGGWWGIHKGKTVMSNGIVGEAWYTEAAERVRFYFSNF